MDESICHAASKDNADFIVRAVNAHEALVEALKQAKRDMDMDIPAEVDWPREAMERIDAALKLAEGL